MNRERFKTILLLSLVCLSLYLVTKVWVRFPYGTSISFEEEVAVLEDYLSIDIIRPHKYLINFNEDSHTIFHSDIDNNLWTSAHSSLGNILSSDHIETEEVSEEEYISYHDKRSIVFYFPEEFNVYILARFLDVPQPNNIVDKIQSVDSIYFYLGKDKPFLVFSHEDFHLKIYESSIKLESLKSKINAMENIGNITYYYPMRDTVDVNNNIYIPVKMSKSIPMVYVENEINTDNIGDLRNIAELFFQQDIDYIREIVENNGSVIYLHDDRVLKINHRGFLEYHAPLEEKVTERNLYISLVTASEFLFSNLPVPKNLYLSKIEEIEEGENLGYRFTFKYRIGGLPVVLKSEVVEDFIQLEVFNKYVTSYKRFIRKEMDTEASSLDSRDMLSAYDIINMNYELIRKDYVTRHNMEDGDEDLIKEEILSRIVDIYIAYVDPCENKTGERLIGVWIVKMEDYIYAFDVYDGNLVVKKEQ
ncbi:MAG: hypothetical protein GXZ06_08570 [Tissierellia bacterium]|nr:hypothetical protein [Tissierellia bacterium]